MRRFDILGHNPAGFFVHLHAQDFLFPHTIPVFLTGEEARSARFVLHKNQIVARLDHARRKKFR